MIEIEKRIGRRPDEEYLRKYRLALLDGPDGTGASLPIILAEMDRARDAEVLLTASEAAAVKRAEAQAEFARSAREGLEEAHEQLRRVREQFSDAVKRAEEAETALETERTLRECADGLLACEHKDVLSLRSQLAQAAKFKSYVHERLDAASVPADPPSPHREHGCRIGGRLDWVFAQLAQAREALKKCPACNGHGRVILPCRFCEDSTHDHECEERVVECLTCKPFRAALSPPSEGSGVEATRTEQGRSFACFGMEADIGAGPCGHLPGDHALPGAAWCKGWFTCRTCPHPGRCVAEKVCTCSSACPHVPPPAGVEREEETKQ